MATFSIGGLATGLDMNGILEKLEAIERRPVARLQKQQDKLQIRKNAWRDMRRYLDNLKSNLADLKLQSTFQSRSVSMSNVDCFDISAAPSAGLESYTLEITSLATRHSVVSEAESQIAWDTLSGEIFIAVGSNEAVSIDLEGLSSLAELRDAINSATYSDESSLKVTASIIDNRLVITSDDTGTDNALGFSDSSGTAILKELGIITVTGELNEISSAKNAELKVNGLSVTRSSNAISDVIEGVTVTLKKETQGQESFKVSQDVAKAKSAVKAFVDQTNSTLEFIQSKLSVGKPEELKSAGDLVSDPTLMRMQSNMRRLVSDSVPNATGDYKTLAQIGVQLDRYGKLTLDDAKLTKAIEENPEGVLSLFAAESGDDLGVAKRLDKYIASLTTTKDGVIDIKTKGLDSSINTLRDSIERMEMRVEQRMITIEKQFIALETAMTRMQSQQDWLYSQINSFYNVKR